MTFLLLCAATESLAMLVVMSYNKIVFLHVVLCFKMYRVRYSIELNVPGGFEINSVL